MPPPPSPRGLCRGWSREAGGSQEGLWAQPGQTAPSLCRWELVHSSGKALRNPTREGILAKGTMQTDAQGGKVAGLSRGQQNHIS